MLFYFTGTGNSLYVARQIEEKPISIPQVLHQENLNFKDEKIGIVYPVYAGEAPKIILEFLEKATFETDYFYFYGNPACYRNGLSSEKSCYRSRRNLS